MRAVWRRLARIEVSGLEHIPASGAFLMAVNHIHMLDTPLFLSFFPRRMVIMVLDRWRKWPVIRWFVDVMGDAIYVSREGVKKEAIACTLNVLRAGGMVAITPEGTVSKQRRLIRGNNGIAFLALRTGVPVLPAVAFGQEKAFGCWVRLRRASICVRFGALISLPGGKVEAAQIERYTEQIMAHLAALLPPEYQGVYSGEGRGS